MGRGIQMPSCRDRLRLPNLSFHWGPSRNTNTPASEFHSETNLIRLSVAGALKVLKAHQVILAYRKFDHHVGSCRCFQSAEKPETCSLGRDRPTTQKDCCKHDMRDLSLPPSTISSQPLPPGWEVLRKTSDPLAPCLLRGCFLNKKMVMFEGSLERAWLLLLQKDR